MEILLIAAAAVILIILIFFDNIREFLSRAAPGQKLPKAEPKQPSNLNRGVTKIKPRGINRPRK